MRKPPYEQLAPGLRVRGWVRSDETGESDRRVAQSAGGDRGIEGDGGGRAGCESHLTSNWRRGCGFVDGSDLTKLVNQIVGSLNLLAVIEGLRVTAAAGLDAKATLRAIGAGAAGSWMVTNIGPKIAAGDFRPGFMIRLQNKDLRLANE